MLGLEDYEGVRSAYDDVARGVVEEVKHFWGLWERVFGERGIGEYLSGWNGDGACCG